MFTDILKKYMNIFIIILYVYILYSYDFKENIQLLLIITGIFIYIIYKNKYNAFTNDIIEGNIIEGNTNDDTTGGETHHVISEADLARLRSSITALQEEINSMESSGNLDASNPRVNELLNLYLELYPGLEINLPNTGDGDSPSLNLGDLPINLEDIPLNLNLDLGSINIPSDLADTYNNNELLKLKKRMRYLEKKVGELDEEDNVKLLKEKVMDLEIENDKWNEKGIEESKEGEESLTQRKVPSNFKTTTPMGMYDGMCLDHLKKENIYKLGDEKDVNTFLGTTLPLNVRKTDNSKLDGPSVDGNENSPKRLNMLETNKTSISCCEDSPYLSSNGCVCLTSDQEDYLVNRGGNHE